jgi:hypothetical protein
MGLEETNSRGSPTLSDLEFSGGVFRGAGVSEHHFDWVVGQAVTSTRFERAFFKHPDRRRFGEFGEGAADERLFPGR